MAPRMTLRFRYKTLRTKRPVVSLGGRPGRPRPLVLVTLVGPAGSYVNAALLDTGADDTVYPEWVARQVGLDLTSAPRGEAAGVTTGAAPLRYAEEKLRLASGKERREWIAWVGFTSAPIKQPLLGFAGFLQYFTATFHGDREEVELAVNNSYPGT